MPEPLRRRIVWIGLKSKKGKTEIHTYKSKPYSLYLAFPLCQLLSWLHYVVEEVCCSTAEDFAHVKTVVKTWEYSSKGPCLARMGIGHLGQEAWAVESTWGSDESFVPTMPAGACQTQRAQGIEDKYCSAHLYGDTRHEDFPDFLTRDRTENWRK